jgi:Lrp/AsnC family transcriptional regulator for asnA, asnC and gidA
LDIVNKVDLQLIACLQQDPRASYATISREIGLSESTVKRRIESLLESGTITLTMIPNFARIGYVSMAFVGLTIDPARTASVAETLVGYPEVTFVTVTLGRYDVVVFVVERSLNRLAEVIMNRIALIDGVRKTETIVAPGVRKAIEDWKIPLDSLAMNEK